MRHLSFLAVSIILFASFVNAEPAQRGSTGEPTPAPQQATEELKPVTLKELIEWLLQEGKDAVAYADRTGPLLGFSVKGVPTKGRGVSRKETAMTDGIGRVCDLVVDKSGKLKPVCLVLFSRKDDVEQKIGKSYKFRLTLNGKLEKAVSGTDKTYVDEKGKLHGVPGSGVDTVLDVTDPDVKNLAMQELVFWQKRAAKLIAQKATSAAVRQ